MWGVCVCGKQKPERNQAVGYTFFFLKENKLTVDRQKKIKMDYLNQSFLSVPVT